MGSSLVLQILKGEGGRQHVVNREEGRDQIRLKQVSTGKK